MFKILRIPVNRNIHVNIIIKKFNMVRLYGGSLGNVFLAWNFNLF